MLAVTAGVTIVLGQMVPGPVAAAARRPAARLAGTVPDATTTADQAVTYQINVKHSGLLAGDSLAPPLTQKWSHRFGRPVSYPLIADGRIFVTVGGLSTYGTRLFALEASTGATAWEQDVPGTYRWSNAAYDGGTVFVLNFDGLLKAFSGDAGVLKWSRQLPGQYAFTSPPTAADGIVYVGGAGSGGTLYAVDELTGAVLWTRPVANGDESSPTLSPHRVFVSYACPQTYAFDRLTGEPRWHYSGPCSGGGGKTAVVHAGLLYVRDVFFAPGNQNGAVLETKFGAVTDRFSAGPAPAFSPHFGFFLNSRTLEGHSLDTGEVAWSFAGDGTLSAAPIVVSQFVYVGATSGELYALKRNTGKLVWSTNVGSGIPAPDEQNVSQPLTGLGAGEGILAIPAGNRLVAYAT
jgi:outer membrane protein assembly factor BamB